MNPCQMSIASVFILMTCLLLSSLVLAQNEKLVDTFSKILHQNIVSPQHETKIIARLKGMSDNKSSIAFYATGRAGCGKTKTFSCIEKAFSQVEYGECQPSNAKCYLQINGFAYNKKPVNFIHQDLTNRIHEFVNKQHEKCKKIFILVEFSQLIHFPLLNVINPFLNDEQVNGIGDTVLLGNIVFLIAGNKGYSGTIHPKENLVEVTTDANVIPSKVNVVLDYDQIDEKIRNDRFYINELNPNISADKRILELSESERNKYLISATQFFKSNKVAFLLFNQQDLKKVIRMKIEELTYTLVKNYNIQVVWRISELTNFVFDHINRQANVKNLYRDGGRAISEYLKAWLSDYEHYHSSNYRILNTNMMRDAHFNKNQQTELMISELTKYFKCSESQMETLVKQLLYFNISCEKFKKLVQTKIGHADSYKCTSAWFGNSNSTKIGGTGMFGSNYEFDEIAQFEENEKHIQKVTAERICKPWDSDNFVGLQSN